MDSGAFFLSFRLIPKKLMSSYTGMEECQKNKTQTLREKCKNNLYVKRYCSQYVKNKKKKKNKQKHKHSYEI